MPTNDYLYLNVSLYVRYAATPTESASGVLSYFPLTVGYAEGDVTYTSTLSHWYSFDQSRVTEEVVALARLSKTEITEKKTGDPYYSQLTGKSYEHMITRTREGIITHGNDYLD